MTLVGLAARNLLRNRFRTGFTILGVAVALVAFLMLRTVLSAWTVAADYASKDRVVSRHKVSFVITLPKRYVEQTRAVPGVSDVTWANWFGAKDPTKPDLFFPTIAVDPESYLRVYDEISLTPEARTAWLEDRQGAIVGDVIARQLGVRVGDKLRLQGTIYPGDWEFNVSGIYEATRKSMDRSQVLFHWNYMNDALPEARRDQVGWLVSRVDNPGASADIARRIDRVFDEQDNQTLSQSERAFNLSFMAMFSSVLSAIDLVSVIILLILLLILGNTIAMGVRERTNEYGVLRALGFMPKHIAMFVLGEAFVLGLVAGCVGVGLGWPFVELGMGRWMEENMGAMFPYFRVEPVTAAVAFGLAIGLASLAAALPAYRASKLTVTDALRRVG